MRHLFLCIVLVLALTQAATAGVLAEPPMAGGRALERAAAPARGLDLGIDGAQLRFAQNAPDEQGDEVPRAKGDVGPYESQSDRGLSFGFEIKPRSRLGALARKDDAEDPDLGDRLDKLIERPVFGLRGRYRF